MKLALVNMRKNSTAVGILTDVSLEMAMQPTSTLLDLITRVIFPRNESSMKKENHDAGSCPFHFFEHRPGVCSVSQALKVLSIFNRTLHFGAEERFFPYEGSIEWKSLKVEELQDKKYLI